MKQRTFRLDKLVRDTVVDSTIAVGGRVDYQTLEGQALWDALVSKLLEEARELQQTQLSIEELADVQEVLETLRENLNISREALQEVQDEKRRNKGGFKKGHFINTVTLPADNKWAAYYAADPTRFPEIKA
jgi:predicted house-cleaning noncanonical NTP pyrophosphatase (MazG superfamily)